MASIDKQIMINASPDRIYNFVIKPSNLTKFWPSIVEIKKEKKLPNGGYCAQWKYRMSGVYLTGSAQCTDVLINNWFTVKISGAADCTITWTFRGTEDMGTKTTLTLDYHLSLPVLRWGAEHIFVKMNNHEADLVLANLRVLMEEAKV
jgi:ribosome-associated toxin RatA of RatAB toxin-antitoxin module